MGQFVIRNIFNLLIILKYEEHPNRRYTGVRIYSRRAEKAVRMNGAYRK